LKHEKLAMKRIYIRSIPLLHRHDHAFTTVELLIVMMIVGILATFLTPQLGRWLTTVRVDAAARELASELQLSKIRAISENTCYRISFDSVNDSYVVQKEVVGGWQDVSAPKSLPNGVDLVSATTDPVFQTLGTTPGGATIRLRNPQGRQRTIRVSFAGRVKME
jgi:prepilin-type N-terminal cleavage/methylation domain-containing protein